MQMERTEYAERKKRMSPELGEWSGQEKKKENGSRNVRVKPGSHTRVKGKKKPSGRAIRDLKHKKKRTLNNSEKHRWKQRTKTGRGHFFWQKRWR